MCHYCVRPCGAIFCLQLESEYGPIMSVMHPQLPTKFFTSYMSNRDMPLSGCCSASLLPGDFHPCSMLWSLLSDFMFNESCIFPIYDCMLSGYRSLFMFYLFILVYPSDILVWNTHTHTHTEDSISNTGVSTCTNTHTHTHTHTHTLTREGGAPFVVCLPLQHAQTGVSCVCH